jgi:hypothetical protein
MSYFPLSPMDRPGELHQITKEDPLPKGIQDCLENQSELSEAKSCLWCRYGEKITPVFAMKGGREICTHLTKWAEEKPGEWFTLYVIRHDTRYAIVLFPNMRKSIERFKVMQLHFNGVIIPEDAKIHVICKPLIFLSMNVGMLEKIQIGNQLHLGFLDVSEVDMKDVHSSPEPDFVGPFEVSREMGENRVYLEHIFK